MNMKVTPAFVIVPILLLLLTWLLMSGLNLNSARYDTELAAFHDFARLERGLNREALTARVGLSRNYDALVHMSDGLTYALDRLREAAGADSQEGGAIEVLEADAAREQELIEHFKKNGVLIGRPFPPLNNYVRVTLGKTDEMAEFWRVWDLAPAHKMEM